MKYIENYPVTQLHEAEYNPRSITPEMFQKLCVSIQRFGVCIPLIINQTGTLIAGHQRTKAIKHCGIQNVPVYMSNIKIAIHDEIRFNLTHNAIDATNANVFIKQHGMSGFHRISASKIEVVTNENVIQITETAYLLCKYGEFGGCVVDSGTGRVIYGQMYASACKQTGIDCLAYVIDSSQAKEFESFLMSDYGEYDFSKLDIKAYNQTHCQMHRLSNERGSRLYEKFVIPALDKSQSYIDFGAGECAYAMALKRKGYDFCWYEPFYKKKAGGINMSATVRMIQVIEDHIVNRHALFDVAILDSVLNSSTSLEFEHCILLTVNSLLTESGILFCSCRCSESFTQQRKTVASSVKRNNLFYADKNNYTATFRCGTWTMQRFLSAPEFITLLRKYFQKVELFKDESMDKILKARCQFPISFPKSEIERVLNIEFNMEYPGGHYHNRHQELVKAVLNLH